MKKNKIFFLLLIQFPRGCTFVSCVKKDMIV